MEFTDQSTFLPRIEELYLELAEKLRAILPESRIEHVGSTSIPDVISKGDLDIFWGGKVARAAPTFFFEVAKVNKSRFMSNVSRSEVLIQINSRSLQNS